MKPMKQLLLVLGVLIFFSLSNSWAFDPVPIPCDPVNCPPIDPCKINPDRCKDEGGPIEKSQKNTVPETSPVTNDKEKRDSCDWCKPCSRTPGSSCLSCCTPGK
ncbi:hypothetical protein EPN18_04125 [bacterium]|nr:MAG: hypothetical protein EPN18_04125 [bacterium]